MASLADKSVPTVPQFQRTRLESLALASPVDLCAAQLLLLFLATTLPQKIDESLALA
jgi:hypothetical protein